MSSAAAKIVKEGAKRLAVAQMCSSLDKVCDIGISFNGEGII